VPFIHAPGGDGAQIELMGPSSSQIGNESNGIQAIGFAAMVSFVYAFNSRVLDLHYYYLHLPMILAVTTGICAFVAGSLFKAFKTRAGLLYLGLTGWFVAGVPFAFWRGGSAGTVSDWLRTLLIWAFLVGLTVTYRECKVLLNTVVVAAATAALMALAGGGGEVEGRLGLEQGLLANPNYFALELLIALPLTWRFYSGGGRPGVFRRLLAAGFGGLILLSFFKSGSRAGLYSLGVMFLLTIVRAKPLRKIQIALVAGVLFVSMFAVLPSYLRERYFTFSSTEGKEYADEFAAKVGGSAAGSTTQRQHVLGQSVTITLTHPIFGVGVGNFAAYVFQINKDQGRRMEAWLGTHNTYAQISSEAGIPALLIWLGILAVTWRSLTHLIRATRHDDRPEARDIYQTAQAAQVCLGSLCFFLFFIHMAYEILPHMVIGLALAVAYTGQRELRNLDAQQLPPVTGDDGGNRVRSQYAA
jgi:O-antigen ligase